MLELSILYKLNKAKSQSPKIPAIQHKTGWKSILFVFHSFCSISFLIPLIQLFHWAGTTYSHGSILSCRRSSYCYRRQQSDVYRPHDPQLGSPPGHKPLFHIANWLANISFATAAWKIYLYAIDSLTDFQENYKFLILVRNWIGKIHLIYVSAAATNCIRSTQCHTPARAMLHFVNSSNSVKIYLFKF